MKKKCPGCGKRIVETDSILYPYNKERTCPVCKCKGCDSCFTRQIGDRKSLIRVEVGHNTYTVVCSKECAVELMRITKEEPVKTVPPDHLPDIEDTDPVRTKRIFELADLYFSKLDESQRGVIRKFGNKNYQRVDLWETPNPDLHKDSSLLILFDELNDLFKDWGYQPMTKEEQIVLYTLYNIPEKLVIVTKMRKQISPETPYEEGIRLYMDEALGYSTNSLERYGIERAKSSDLYSDNFLLMRFLTLWVFVLTTYGKKLPIRDVIKEYDRYYLKWVGKSSGSHVLYRVQSVP